MKVKLYQHYLIKERFMVLNPLNIHLSPDPQYWDNLGEKEVKDDGMIAHDLNVFKETREITKELLMLESAD